MKRRWTWAIGTALVATAWAVAHVTPTDEITTAYFPVAATVGQPASGRALAATVTDVRLTDRAVAGGWFAEGTWLLVDIEAEAVREERLAALRGVTFTVGDRTYRASERPAQYTDPMFRAPLAVGLARQGTLAFELPDDASGRGTLRLSLLDDTRLDSVIEVPIDLDDLDRVAESQLLETGWAS